LPQPCGRRIAGFGHPKPRRRAPIGARTAQKPIKNAAQKRRKADRPWREDNRRKPNGTNWNTVIGAALAGAKSPVWTGYWHRSAA
jgi:hypothetical protein